jgi:outer membrane immunogenic protein
MKKLTRIFVSALLSSLPLTAVAQRPANTIDAYATYSEMRANAPVGGCSCFWMSGGVGGFSVPVWRDFSAVVEAGGNLTDHIPNFNTGLSLLYGLGGVRMRVPNHTRFQPFGQALFGGVHGFDSYFPAPVGKLPTSYDTSFALTVGGGLDIAVSKHIWIRALQADYFYSELRNIQGDRQNQFRIGAGILFRGSETPHLFQGKTHH